MTLVAILPGDGIGPEVTAEALKVLDVASPVKFESTRYDLGAERYLATGEVLPDAVTVLAQIAERAEDIDLSRAEAARKRAEERLSRNESDLDYARARTALDKAVLRVQVASRSRAR